MIVAAEQWLACWLANPEAMGSDPVRYWEFSLPLVHSSSDSSLYQRLPMMFKFKMEISERKSGKSLGTHFDKS